MGTPGRRDADLADVLRGRGGAVVGHQRVHAIDGDELLRDRIGRRVVVGVPPGMPLMTSPWSSRPKHLGDALPRRPHQLVFMPDAGWGGR